MIPRASSIETTNIYPSACVPLLITPSVTMKITAALSHSLLGIFLALLLVLSVVSPVAARDTDVIKTGACSGGGTYKLKLSEENGRLEIEFEVEHRSNQQWNVVIKRRNNVIFRGKRTTSSASQSFTARVVNGPGTGGQVQAVATRSGQRCVATATYA